MEILLIVRFTGKRIRFAKNHNIIRQNRNKKSLGKSLFLGLFSGVEIVTRCKSVHASVAKNAFTLKLTVDR